MAKNCCPSSSSSSGRLRQEPSITKNCWSSSSSSAGRLRQEPSFTQNCCSSSSKCGCSKWQSRAQVAESCLKVRRADCVTNAPVPQGTTALSTPPFVRAGYGCRNNTTVLSRPEAVGVGTPRVGRPADYLPSGTVGQWPPATGQWWNERRGRRPKNRPVRHKGAATQKPTSERRNSRSNLGARGGDPRTLASWRHLFSASCRGNCRGIISYTSYSRTNDYVMLWLRQHHA